MGFVKILVRCFHGKCAKDLNRKDVGITEFRRLICLLTRIRLDMLTLGYMFICMMVIKMQILT